VIGHEKTSSTWSYETETPLSLNSIHDAARKLPATIYRCKGMIHSSEEPHRRAVRCWQMNVARPRTALKRGRTTEPGSCL